MVICLERGADLHMAQLIPLLLTVSCFSIILIGLPFWYWLTQVVPEKGPLNVCVCNCLVCVVDTCNQVEVIDDMVQKICQQIRSLNFTSVSDDQKKECKKRNLIKEELVFTRHYFQCEISVVEIEWYCMMHAYTYSIVYSVASHLFYVCHVTPVYLYLKRRVTKGVMFL